MFLSATKKPLHTSRQPMELVETRKLITIHAGYGKQVNRAAGVTLMLNKRWIRRANIRSYAYLSHPLLVGRAFAIRLKLKHKYDLLICVIYVPPCDNKGPLKLDTKKYLSCFLNYAPTHLNEHYQFWQVIGMRKQGL